MDTYVHAFAGPVSYFPGLYELSNGVTMSFASFIFLKDRSESGFFLYHFFLLLAEKVVSYFSLQRTRGSVSYYPAFVLQKFVFL